MPTLEDLKERSQQELFEQLESKTEISKQWMDDLIHRISQRHVPIVYQSILQIAKDNTELVSKIPTSASESNYSPIVLIKSNIYELISKHLHKSFYDFNPT